ncbi:MAG: hypothetical protein ABEL97_00555 [Salinibacter sp.]
MRSPHRVIALTLSLLLIGLSSARGQLPSNELEGTWKMVSQKLVYPDSVVDQSDHWGTNYKILNSTHFAWGRETQDSSQVLAGGGTYEYYPERNVYIEHVQYHSDPAFAGQTLKFTARVEGDTWYHIGDLGNYKLREVWKRVDPDTVRQRFAAQDTTMGGSN